METMTPKSKILRVGLVQKGKVIDERLMRQKSAITVGDSHRNTFVIPALNFPARFPLFEIKNDSYYLNFPEWMQGKINHSSMTFSLSSACEKDLAKPSGHVRFSHPGKEAIKQQPVTVYQMKLDEKSRGVLNFGDFALLFQFVAPPPRPKQAALPAALKGGFWKGGDWVYSSILMLSFVAHTGFVYWCKTMGELPMNAPSITDRFADHLRCLKNCNKPKKPAQPWLAKKAENKPKDKKVKPKKKSKAKTTRRPRRLRQKNKRVQSKAVAMERLRTVGMLAMLTSKGKNGKYRNILDAGGKFGQKLDQSLRNHSGFETSEAKLENNRGRRRGKILTQKDDSLDYGSTARVGVLTQPGTRRKRVRLTSKLQKLEVDSGALPSGVWVIHVMKRIRRYERTLRYCYERALKGSPGLQGKILFSITVALSGRVSSVELEENGLNRMAGQCMVRAIKRWRLFKLKREAVTISVPFVFYAQ